MEVPVFIFTSPSFIINFSKTSLREHISLKKKVNFMKSIITSPIFILSLVAVSGQQLSTLPISLKNFSVNLKNEATIEVRWDIIHQNNASGYSIQHSVDTKNWQPVGFIDTITNH